jgi:hypothetical protein
MQFVPAEIDSKGRLSFKVSEGVSYVRINHTVYEVRVFDQQITVAPYIAHTGVNAEEKRAAEAEALKKHPPPRKVPHPSAAAQWKRESSRRFGR